MEISRQVFNDIHEIFQVAGNTADFASFMNQMIRLLFSQVFAESSVVHFSEEIKDSKGDIEVNLDQTFVRQYKNYYHRYDPVKWLSQFTARPVVLMEDLIDYKDFMTGEFYNDFLVPQKIHHKLYLNLYSGFNHHARIGLYRSRKAQQFSRKEIRMLKLISPYLGHAVDHHKLLVNNRLQNIFSDILDENISRGIILLDASFNIIHMNHAAGHICKNLFNSDPEKAAAVNIPESLIEDCRILEHESRSGPDACLPMARYKTLSMPGGQQLCISSRILLKEITSENKKFFLVHLEEHKTPQKQLEDRLEERYHLTGRECEIIRYLFRGLRNADIAKMVFLSEITVKKHLQSIFRKLKVKNRASAVRKIAEEQAII